MEKIFSIICLGLLGLGALAQGNCEMYPENSNERKACEYGYKAIEYKQGSRQSQLLFDTAIALNPNYAWAYYEKSVPYFKRGLLHEGILLLNKAVELDPLAHLTYRAYWYFQHKSYQACKADLERFYNMPGNYQKYTPGGGMDMRIIWGMTHYHLGQIEQAIETVETAIALYKSEDFAGPYDYHVLGILYYMNGEYNKAQTTLQKAVSWNPNFADTYYYLALSHKVLGETEASIEALQKALLKFEGKEGGYTGHSTSFRATKKQVEDELKHLLN